MVPQISDEIFMAGARNETMGDPNASLPVSETITRFSYMRKGYSLYLER